MPRRDVLGTYPSQAARPARDQDRPNSVISVYEPCSACRGVGFDAETGSSCSVCDRTGRQWAPGAPLYGCESTIADRVAGEIVTIGTGERARILWHQKVSPQTTFLAMIDDFTDAEGHAMVPYPSCIGVASVDVSRVNVDRDNHENDRSVDDNDPMQRRLAGRLL